MLSKAFAAQEGKEYEYKAKMMKSIIEMVGWPAKAIPASGFNLCISPEFPFKNELRSLNNATAAGHKITVKTLTKLEDPNNNCQMVFLYQLTPQQQESVIKFYDKKPVLLLGDMDSFALRGGSMNFTHLNNVLAVTVNTDAMKNSELYIDLKSVDRITVIPQAKDLQ